jgi:hypothetical protein
MCKKIIGILILLMPLTVSAQEEAVTSSGKTVLLFPDSTWKLKLQNDAPELQGKDSTSTGNDTLAVAKPEKSKGYSDASTGFIGFLKPELKLPALPEQSDGIYEFRVKVNKEGYVKEVVTLKRGNNGQAEALMRKAITELKYRPNGSAVPPLTEGIIRISVPSGK